MAAFFYLQTLSSDHENAGSAIAQADEHLWASNYDRELKDIFAIQSEVAKEIADQLHATISPATTALIDRVPTDKLEAYDYLVRGREKVINIESSEQALEYFQKALQIDPDLAAAHAALSWFYSLASVQNFIPPSEGIPLAEKWLHSAEQLDTDLAEINQVRASINLFFRWEWEKARADCEIAYQKNPGSADTMLMFSFYYMAIGQDERAIKSIQQAIDLDPLNMRLVQQLIEWYRLTHRYDEAEALCFSMLDRDPGFGGGYRLLGMLYCHMGRMDEAIENAEKASKIQGGKGWSAINLATIYATAGKEIEARNTLQEMLDGDFDIHIPGYAYTMIYAALGDLDEAFSWLETSFQDKDYWASQLNYEPFYAPLKSDPRFEGFADRLEQSK